MHYIQKQYLGGTNLLSFLHVFLCLSTVKIIMAELHKLSHIPDMASVTSRLRSWTGIH